MAHGLESYSVSLREFFEVKHAALASLIEAWQRVVEARFESHNEFRKQILEERETYLRKAEFDLMLAELRKENERRDLQVQFLITYNANLTGKLLMLGSCIMVGLVITQIMIRVLWP